MVFFSSSLALTCLVFALRIFPNPPRYHFMQVVQTWAPTFCADPNVQCDTPVPLDFTLHGLWPADSTGKSLTYCRDPNPRRDLKPLYESLPDLSVAWPSINKNMLKEKFWEHEYRKHGVCSRHIVDETQYFTAAIQIRRRINLLDSFQREKIIPSHHRPYTRRDIIKAVQKATSNNNAYIYISCHRINRTHAMLHEVYTCLNPTLTSDVSCPAPRTGRHPVPRGCYDNHGYSMAIVLPPS